MNEIVSFSKEIEFKTNIDKITSIALEHTLEVNPNNMINGNLIISGTYKQTETSQIENPFSYKLPVDIELDNKYILDNVNINIDDFTYEFNDNVLKINVDILIDNLEVREEKTESKEEIEVLDDLFEEMDDKEALDIPVKENDDKPEVVDDCKESLFSNIDNSKETYQTYSVYIIRENDMLEDIINKFNTTREKLEEYNDLTTLQIGTKLIIPNTKDDKKDQKD